MKLILIFLITTLPLSWAAASAFSTSEMSVESPRMPGLFRVGVLGTSNAKNTSDQSFAIFGGLGRGMISFEIGVSYLTISDQIELSELDSNKTTNVPVSASYTGIPVHLKWNYIEKPLSTFYVKTGVMPISLNSQSRGDEPVANQSLLAVGGIGGTAAVTKSTAFILDITHYWNRSEGNDGIPSQSLTLGAGLSFDL